VLGVPLLHRFDGLLLVGGAHCRRQPSRRPRTGIGQSRPIAQLGRSTPPCRAVKLRH
jgi:hypothetical protein